MIAEARKQNVFFMEGYWTKFFPIYQRIKTILTSHEIGEPHTVVVQFGWPAAEDEAMMDAERGGGALLAVGCYLVMFARMIFEGEEPIRVTSSAVLTKTGVDESVSVTLEYSHNRVAQLFFTTVQTVSNNAVVIGTKGTFHIPEHFLGPTRFVNPQGVVEEHPLPKTDQKFNFINCVGLSYEADGIRQCLLKGLKECPEMPLAESAAIAKLCDQIRAQIGVQYEQDV